MIDTKILIAELSPEALHGLADQFCSVSHDLRAAAKSKAAALSRESASQAHRRRLETIPDLVAGYVAGGMTPEAAIRAAGIAAGVEAETVQAWLRHRRREIDRGQREAKKARVLALADQGFSIREIAAKAHVSRSTVGRLVKAAAEQAQELTGWSGTAPLPRDAGAASRPQGRGWAAQA